MSGFVRIAAWLFAAAAMAFIAAEAQAQNKIIRVGYQKYGNAILLKGTGGLEKKLAPLGFKVEWKEFPSGPPLLEALNADAIDFGHTGEHRRSSPRPQGYRSSM
jgi:sulfonate transport system substrate-binding protein